jgi:hypothetical protein
MDNRSISSTSPFEGARVSSTGSLQILIMDTGLEIHDSNQGICCVAHLNYRQLPCIGALPVSLCSKANLPTVFSIKNALFAFFCKNCCAPLKFENRALWI